MYHDAINIYKEKFYDKLVIEPGHTGSYNFVETRLSKYRTTAMQYRQRILKGVYEINRRELIIKKT